RYGLWILDEWHEGQTRYIMPRLSCLGDIGNRIEGAGWKNAGGDTQAARTNTRRRHMCGDSIVIHGWPTLCRNRHQELSFVLDSGCVLTGLHIGSRPGSFVANAGHRRLEDSRESGVGEDAGAVEDLQPPAWPRCRGGLEQTVGSIQRVEDELHRAIRWHERGRM